MAKRNSPALWLLTLGNGGQEVLVNEALGGTITEIENYNGTGETWRVHTLSSSGTLEVLSSPQPFRVLVVGGGGGAQGLSGSPSVDDEGGGGGAGEVQDLSNQILPTGSLSVTVGAGGATNNNGGSSSVHSITSTGGSRGNGYSGGASGNGYSGGTGQNAQGGGGAGAGENGYQGYDWFGGDGGNGVQSDISGSSVYYGGGGAAGGIKDLTSGLSQTGGWDTAKNFARRPDRRGSTPLRAIGGLGGGTFVGQAATANTGAGGSYNNNSSQGGSGIVVVAYKIG